MKRGVKKGSLQARSFMDRLQERKDIETIKLIVYSQQEIMDAVYLTLHQEFGLGPDRLKRFHDAFEAKFAEIKALAREDDDLAIAKMEQALKAACGKHYQNRVERYTIRIKKGEI